MKHTLQNGSTFEINEDHIDIIEYSKFKRFVASKSTNKDENIFADDSIYSRVCNFCTGCGYFNGNPITISSENNLKKEDILYIDSFMEIVSILINVVFKEQKKNENSASNQDLNK